MSNIEIVEEFTIETANLILKDTQYVLREVTNVEVRTDSNWRDAVKAILFRIFRDRNFFIDENSFANNEIEEFYFVRHLSNIVAEENGATTKIIEFPVCVLVINEAHGLKLYPSTTIFRNDYLPDTTRVKPEVPQYVSRLCEYLFSSTRIDKCQRPEDDVARMIQEKINSKYAGASKIATGHSHKNLLKDLND